MIIFFRRAALAAALFFITNSFAVEQKQKALNNAKVETYKDLISKSQVLLMQKDRAQAINILLMGLQKEDQKSIAHQELVKRLNKITHMFLAETVQSIYELAIALDSSPRVGSSSTYDSPTADSNNRNNKKLAIDKLNEALSVDSQNLQIIKGLLVRYLSDNNCSKALKLLESFKQINPYETDLLFFQVHLAVCQKDQAKYLEIKKNNDSNSQVPADFWYLSDLRFKLFLKNEALLGDSPKSHYPEILYLQRFLFDANSKERANLSEEYLQHCKAWKSPYVGANFPDPWVCSNIKEVEETKEKK